MHHKNIKYAVRKQLKTQFPNWRRLDRKTKRTFATQVLKEVVAGYENRGLKIGVRPRFVKIGVRPRFVLSPYSFCYLDWKKVARCGTYNFV